MIHQRVVAFTVFRLFLGDSAFLVDYCSVWEDAEVYVHSQVLFYEVEGYHGWLTIFVFVLNIDIPSFVNRVFLRPVDLNFNL